MMFVVEDPNENNDDREESREKRNAIRPDHPSGATLWPNGLVPYEISSAFGGEPIEFLHGMHFL